MLKSYRKLVAASKVRFGYYLNHIGLHSLLKDIYSLFGPLLGTFITKFISENPRTDNIVMFNFAECLDKCRGQPWKFPITGSDKLVM